jgi:hypothetical protein
MVNKCIMKITDFCPTDRIEFVLFVIVLIVLGFVIGWFWKKSIRGTK